MTSRREFLLATAGSAIAMQSALAESEPKPKQLKGNPYLQDIFLPVKEEVSFDNLKVIGKIPNDLRGMFVRNGPNPQFPPGELYHLFEGDGMLHGVQFRDGKASYLNRYVRTAGWQAEHDAGKRLYPSLFDRDAIQEQLKLLLQGKFPFKNAGNTALVWHHDKLLALWEGGKPHEIRLPKLETVGPYDFAGKLKHAFSAHPKVDPETGEMLVFGYGVTPPYVQYSVINPDGTVRSTTPIELPRAVMMHDFAITKNYSIFLDLPYVINIAAALVKKLPIRFAPEFGARLGVLPRYETGDKIRWFDIDPCFVFHVLNAFEQGEDEVVLLACRSEQYPEFASLTTAPKAGDAHIKSWLDKKNQARLHRWTINLKSGTVKEEELDDTPAEMPRIHDGLAGRPTDFGYAIRQDFGEQLLKYDLRRGETIEHKFPKGHVCTEGVFVPRSEAKSEDDGWLLSYVCRRGEDVGELAVIDCRDFAGEPVSRVLIPQRVPYGFHGVWVPEVS